MASFGLLFLALGLGFYFLPAIVGRNKSNIGAIFLLNLLLGWTLVGWVVALVWAMTAEAPVASSTVYMPMPAGAMQQSLAACSQCGRHVASESKFCAHCGTPRLAPA